MLGPITAISPASQVFLPVSQAGKAKTIQDPYSGVPAFWRQLHQRLAGTPGDSAKFGILTRMAQEMREIPAGGDNLPPEIALSLHEDEVKEWAREQRPGVRGRLYRLMQGLGLLTPWPYTVLQ